MSEQPARCPTCGAVIWATGVIRRDGLVFCAACRVVLSADKQVADPRRIRPL